MSASLEGRPIPSDATLVWLASERAAPLFRTLDRSRAFGPLVVLLAVLPSVLATFAEVVTPIDAAWGLRALDAAGSELPPEALTEVEAVVPADSVCASALWLSAFALRTVEPARPVSSSVVSLIGGAALLGILWSLARSLGGRRFAFWAVLLAAFHPTLTALLLVPVPVTVALSAAATALWGHLNLQARSWRGALAGALTAASIAVGLLLVGPAALTVPLAIVLDAGLALLLPAPATGDRRQARDVILPRQLAVRRLAATAAGLILWLVATQLVPDPGLASPAGPIEAPDVEISPAIKPSESAIVGPLWGLAAIGLGRLLRVVHRRAAARSPRPLPRTLLVWLLAAGGLALWKGKSIDGFDPSGWYALAHASLPLLLAAAYAIEESARRLISSAWVVLAIALPLAVRVGSVMATVRPDSPVVWALLAVGAAAGAWVVAKAVPALVPQTGLRRGSLMAAILAAVAINSADGLRELFRAGRDDEGYRRLVNQLASQPSPAAAVLLTGAASPPPELVFAVRASFPQAVLEVSASWEMAADRLRNRFGEKTFDAAVAVWGAGASVTAAAGEDLAPVGEPLLFGDRELLLYRISPTL